jgi:hypothetical protein
VEDNYKLLKFDLKNIEEELKSKKIEDIRDEYYSNLERK